MRFNDIQKKSTKATMLVSMIVSMAACQPQSFSDSDDGGVHGSSYSSQFAAYATTVWNKCQVSGLKQASNYNVFVLGDATQPSSDTQGRFAAGGDVYVSNYSVGDQLSPDATRIDFLVGGKLIFPSGAVMSGRTVYGTDIEATSAATSFGGFSKEDHSSEFQTAGTSLKNLSAKLGSMKINVNDVAFDFTGGSRSFTNIVGTLTSNVVGITTDDLERTHTLTIKAPQGSSMLINVYGETAVFSGMEIKLEGIQRDHVLFNFVQATKLHIGNISVEGSVLAPLADVVFPAGQLNGQFVGGTLYGQGQFNLPPFQGCLPVDEDPEVPETPTTPVDLCGPQNEWAKFNVITFGNFTQSGTDTEGRLAVGGTATLQWYAVGLELSADASRYDLIAKDLVFTGGSIYKGSVAYFNSASVNNATVYGQVVQDTSALNFTNVKTKALSQSSQLNSLAVNGTTTVQYWGGPTAQITLTGADTTRNVFSLSGTDLSNANTLNINVPANSTVVINVSGTQVSMSNFGIFLSGATKSNIVFNMPSANSLNISGIGIQGSILAPLADVNFSSGQFNGSLVSQSVVGNGQFNHATFQGCIPQ